MAFYHFHRRLNVFSVETFLLYALGRTVISHGTTIGSVN